jgi:adiponectin receptor
MSSEKPSDGKEKSSNFVEPSINAALQQARQIVTHGKADANINENVIEESTAVQVKKSNNKQSPVEVTISRSRRVVSQSSSEDEGEKSDNDVISDRTQTLSSKSTENLSNDIHTEARYARGVTGLWRRESEDDIRLDDQAHLLVDVTEKTEADIDGHKQTTTTWTATWTVQNFEMLPEWLQDNEYLISGHRPPMPSFAECFKSIWSLHTETGNIWTHLIGCIAFFILAAWFLTRPKGHIDFQEKLVFSFFFAGAIVCLGLSFVFHTLSCHSVPVVRLFSKLDYMGISLLIIGSFIPWIYYGFYCRREPKVTYIAMIVVVGIGAIVVSLWDKFSESRYRPLRAGVFVAMASSGIIPTVHFIYTDGMRTLIDENSFIWLVVMAGLYLLGAFLYATRTPERFFPGKCDIWFQSHQLFHLCVVVAAFTHFYGVQEMAYKRLTGKCPNELDTLTSPNQPFYHNEL